MSEALEYFSRIRENNIMALKDFKDNGGKVVGMYCTYGPQELVIAGGARPVGLCGTSEKPIPAAEEILPRNLCPLIKSSFGFAVSDTCPFFNFSDMIVGETTCDGKKKMFERMQDLKTVHVMQLPHQMQIGSAMELWTAEMGRLKASLENQLGTTITNDNIREAIALLNRESEAIKAVCDLNQQKPAVLSGLELLTVTWSRFFNSDKNETIKMADQLIEEIKTRNPLPNSNGPRVLLTGSPVGLGSDKVIRLVEELGGVVVAAENCSGYKTLELRGNADLDNPLEALAMKYSQIPCSCMTPNTGRLDLLSRMAKDFQVDAVIDLTWQACHTYNIEAFEVEKLMKSLSIPYLHLESDYSESDLQSLKLRIEALLEMTAA